MFVVFINMYPTTKTPHSTNAKSQAPGVEVVDHADHTLPPLETNGRVIDLTNGQHFDYLMQDTPDELRPPSLIMFHGHKQCPGYDAQVRFTELSETVLPARERLMIAKYDMDAAPVRAWFKFTPEMDLAKRFGVTKCSLVFAPRSCDGYTTWCEMPTGKPGYAVVGCADFVDKCGPQVQIWDGHGQWAEWAVAEVRKQGEPEISPVLGSYLDQGRWLVQRDDVTTDNEARNFYLVEAFPAFTKLGYLAMETPKQMQDWFVDFWHRRKRNRVLEQWDSSQTQMSFHDSKTTFVSLDQEGHVRDKLANEIIKPIVEKWSGMRDLELTSFYGIREYYNNWLRGHIDRIDTHVLSVTFTVGKVNASDVNQILSPEAENALPKWPLEVVAYDGLIHRYDHPGGIMVLYESSKLIHGRPYINRGPPHLGAFCHFKPRNMDAVMAAAWEKVASDARAHQSKNTKRVRYRSAETVEPERPVFSKKRYGEDTGFVRTGQDDSASSRNDQKKLQVTFKNESDRPLAVVWVPPEGEPVEQTTLAPGASTVVNSYLGHRFAWVKPGTTLPLPKGLFTIEAGSRLYRYTAKMS